MSTPWISALQLQPRLERTARQGYAPCQRCGVELWLCEVMAEKAC